MKIISFLEIDRPNSANKIGWIAFQIGVFFLPSTAFISALFLLIASFTSSFQKGNNYFKDPWNYPFLIASFLMIIGCIGSYSGWLAWIGLANWLPFFWIFWAFQAYLTTSLARRRCLLCFLSGSVPVVVTGIGQMFWGWEGPFQLFNGLIVWFISPGGEPLGRLSGLFDYANIAGAWLAFVWPICLAALLQQNLSFGKRSFIFTFAILIVVSLILTDSRNAWGSLIVVIPFILGPLAWPWLFPFLALITLPVVFSVLPWFGTELQQWARNLVPEALWSRLSDIQYVDQRVLASTRLNQWSVAIDFLLERPWLGWGAAAFSILYPLKTGQWHGHAHNLPLEVAVSHGMPVAVLIVSSVFVLLIKSMRSVILFAQSKATNYLKTTIYDRAWWTAAFILIIFHASDMPSFDSRLNIAGWTLLAGLRCLIKKNEINFNQNSL